MNYSYILSAIAVMAVMTYLPRVIPILLFRNKIKNKYIQSFLLYMPYAILAAMVFPDVFQSTNSIISASIGCAVALILSYKNVGLLGVAISSTLTVFIVEQILKLF